jgi:hypothetical protein
MEQVENIEKPRSVMRAPLEKGARIITLYSIGKTIPGVPITYFT